MRTRSIPACTGEPCLVKELQSLWRVYPRVYGGTPPAHTSHHTCIGLSPRVRGNLDVDSSGTVRSRSIPACTGEPGGGCSAISIRGVYPRVYGGTTGDPAVRGSVVGLSPRVRGNLQKVIGRNRREGSIPACTGEPRATGAKTHRAEVYPRVYGGTHISSHTICDARGLSPRVRGNQADGACSH